jgi:hypothetical protein
VVVRDTLVAPTNHTGTAQFVYATTTTTTTTTKNIPARNEVHAWRHDRIQRIQHITRDHVCMCEQTRRRRATRRANDFPPLSFLQQYVSFNSQLAGYIIPFPILVVSSSRAAIFCFASPVLVTTRRCPQSWLVLLVVVRCSCRVNNSTTSVSPSPIQHPLCNLKCFFVLSPAVLLLSHHQAIMMFRPSSSSSQAIVLVFWPPLVVSPLLGLRRNKRRWWSPSSAPAAFSAAGASAG